jgi:hypothetical protein
LVRFCVGCDISSAASVFGFAPISPKAEESGKVDGTVPGAGRAQSPERPVDKNSITKTSSTAPEGLGVCDPQQSESETLVTQKVRPNHLRTKRNELRVMVVKILLFNEGGFLLTLSTSHVLTPISR